MTKHECTERCVDGGHFIASTEEFMAFLAEPQCTCPSINVTGPGDRGQRFVKGVDWDCRACVDVTEDAKGNELRLFKPHIDGRTRYQTYSNVPPSEVS